jgi:hypothetical protein
VIHLSTAVSRSIGAAEQFGRSYTERETTMKMNLETRAIADEQIEYDALIEHFRHNVVSRSAAFLSVHEADFYAQRRTPRLRKLRMFFFAQQVLKDVMIDLQQLILHESQKAPSK